MSALLRRPDVPDTEARSPLPAGCTIERMPQYRYILAVRCGGAYVGWLDPAASCHDAADLATRTSETPWLRARVRLGWAVMWLRQAWRRWRR